jgi:RNA polymerase sigma-70 factor (ECF subfamily)
MILRDDGRAEDATQEALVAAWRDLSALRDPDRFDAWLHRLLVRACYREAGRQRRRLEVEGNVRPLSLHEPDASVGLADRDELERGFRRLSTDQRAILVMHYYLGYPLSEVAEMLHVPAGTVKSRLHRANQALRTAIEADAAPVLLSDGRPA